MLVDLFCSCESGIPNTGQPGCIDGFSRDVKFIIVNYRDDSGAINSIKSGDFTAGQLTQAFVTGKINAADKSQRWYITEQFRVPTPERADPITEDIDGVDVITDQGNLNYSVQFIGKKADPEYVGRLNAICQDWGFFSVDNFGNIKGVWENGELRPMRVEPDTTIAIYRHPQRSAKQKIEFRFTADITERDSRLKFIKASHIDANMLDEKGLIDVVGTVEGTPTTTTFTVKTEFCYGEAFNLLPFKGAVLADWDLNEVSPTPGPIAITSATEQASTPGTYDFVIPAQTSGDVLELDLQKDGFEMATVTVNIP